MAGYQDAPAVTRAPAKAPTANGYQAAPVAAPAKSGKKKTSQGLGFMEAMSRPFEQMNRATPEFLRPPDRNPGENTWRKLHDYYDKREETERPGLLGGIAGTILGTAPVLLATRNPLVAGGFQGALSSEHDDLGGTLLDAAGGAVLNKVGGKVVDKVTDTLAPVVAPVVDKLRAAGIKTITPGQMKGKTALDAEDKAMSRPVVGPRIAADRAQFQDEFNRGAVNRAVMPLGLRLPDNIRTGHEAAEWMQQQVGAAYDTVLPKLSLAPDARLAVGMRKSQMIGQSLAPEQQAQLVSIIKANLDFNAQGGVLSGRALTRGLRTLRDRAAGYSRSSNEGERQLGEALGEIVQGVDSSLLAQNPTFAPVLKATNKAYRDSLVVNRASAAADDGIATTAQYKVASKAVDRTKGKRATAAGKGPMQDYVTAGRTVTGKTPNSGTAERLMDGKILPKVRGAFDAAMYEADKALAPLRLAPRSPQAKKLAGLLAKYRDPISIMGGPAIGGLLAGLLPNE